MQKQHDKTEMRQGYECTDKKNVTTAHYGEKILLIVYTTRTAEKSNQIRM